MVQEKRTRWDEPGVFCSAGVGWGGREQITVRHLKHVINLEPRLFAESEQIIRYFLKEKGKK